MKRKRDYFFPICVVIFLLILFIGGCVGMNHLEQKIKQQFSNNTDIFLAHMEEKYGIHFLPISYTSSSAVVNEEFRCYAEGTNPDKDYVSVFRKEENGKTVFYDDYFGIIIRDEYQKRVQNICNEAVGESKAYIHKYSVSYFDNSLTAQNTIDDAISIGESINAVKYIFFEVETGEEQKFVDISNQICNELFQNKFPGIVMFFGLAEGELDNITTENFLTYIPNMVKPDGKICMMMTSHTVTME